MKSKQTLLEKMVQMQSLPFYDKGFRDSEGNVIEKNLNDSKEYHALQDKIENSSKDLKVGDKVQFNFPKQIKDKSKSFGFRLENQLMEGVVKKAYHTRKRERYGEDCSFQLLKVASDGYVYDVSPDSVIKL